MTTTLSDARPYRTPAPGLLLLMSVATGLAVAGNYFAQPLLDVISSGLGFDGTVAALIVAAGQVGYAAGLMLLVPLGDLVERRRLAVTLLGATALFLLVSASAWSGPVLLAGTVLTAVTSVAAQVIVPFAVSLADPEHRGRVVGTVMTGLLTGSLLARPAAGALSELGGWRTVYWLNALLVAGVAVLLWRRLPALHTPAALRYPALLRSTVRLFRDEPLLRWRAGIAALSLAGFNGFWTVLTFLLAGPYGWREGAIGLFGLVGVLGAMATPLAGRLADRGHVQRLTGGATVGLIIAWVAISMGESSLFPLIGGMSIFTIAQQVLLNGNQNVIYALRPEIRNRLNSAFMTAFFAGGAAGSALMALAWSAAGWTGVSLLGTALATGTLILWILERRSLPNRASSAALP